MADTNKLLYPAFYEDQISMHGNVVTANQVFNRALVEFLRNTDFPKEILDMKEQYIEVESVCDFRAYNTASHNTPLKE